MSIEPAFHHQTMGFFLLEQFLVSSRVFCDHFRMKESLQCDPMLL